MKQKMIISLLLAFILLLGGIAPCQAEGASGTAEEFAEEPGSRVSFLISGIDRRSNGTTTSGTEVHADTVIIVSVDFENSKVDLISLARDTFIQVPGHKGFYKLNAAFNVGGGGGMNDPDKGFAALAATAGEVLGGISIPYYIAVDLQTLVDLVDAVGGVDLDVDMSYVAGARHYKAGFQHVDGLGFLDYVQARKNATVEKNDVGRTNRQRKALIALYKQVKSSGIITSIPSIIASVKDGLWTNISLTQMATLANFALNFDPDNVGTHSLTGKIKVNHGWAYHFVDQKARQELIRSVYGFDAEPYGIDSESFIDYLHNTGFYGRKTIAMAEKVFNRLSEQVAGGKEMTDKQAELYNTAYLAYEEAVSALDALDRFMILYCDGVPRDKKEEQKKVKDAYNTTQKASKKATIALGKTLGFNDKDYQWAVWPVFYKDQDINEIRIDFN